MTKVVERNTTIPTKRSEIFVTEEKNQTTIVLHILEGEWEQTSRNRSLAVLELTDLPRHPKGTPLVEVTFDIDANGILHVTGEELRVAGSEAAFTGRSCSATVNRSTAARAAALVRSPRRQSLRDLVPRGQVPSEPSES
ncbi:Hsp70 family protein [Streptomyces siamensis]|uniref:Uncharacterized protein n=1 Tax=Streptomyces siamensis TaxID=1274986 RepID=A0ABP9J6W2_9ACTN